MKTHIFILLIGVVLNSFVYGQQMPSVGIGTPNPHPSAALEIDSPGKNRGLLLPRVALQSTTDIVTVPTPPIGMLVYNTAAAGSGNTAVIANKLYQWDGTKWQALLDTDSLPDFGIPRQILSVNSNPGTPQDIGSNANFIPVGKVISLPIKNVDILNAFNISNNTFTVPTGENGTYIVNYQSFHDHVTNQPLERDGWFIVMTLQKSTDNGTTWTNIIGDANTGLTPNDGANSSVLFWTGQLNVGDKLRVFSSSSAGYQNYVLNAGLAITKL